MNTKTLLTISALALGLYPASLPTRADSPTGGMDMGSMKMSPKPMAQKPSTAPLTVAAAVSPAAPQAGDNALDLTITGPDGKPAMGLKLTTTVAMTSMDMGTTHPAVTETGGGHYATKVSFSMNGPWRVVVRNGTNKVAVLDFEAGAKTPWKSPPIKTPVVKAASATSIGAAPTPPPTASTMPGMEMSTPAAKPAAASTPQPEAAKPTDGGGMAGMDMKGTDMKGMTGIADMKTATIPELQEKGTYTATGDENWEKQTGFGHNAGMVAMMNQMMVGGSGMEGMKMPAMTMKFDEQNYAKPEADDADTTMPGMDMSGKAADKKSGPGSMAGMKMEVPPPVVKSNTPVGEAKAKPGMDMSAPTPTGPPLASAPVKITATTASAPKAGDNSLTISIIDAQGKPVTGAAVTTSVAMTSMDMGTAHPAVKDIENGHYTATVTFGMAGPWRVTVKALPPGQKPVVKAFDFMAK